MAEMNSLSLCELNVQTFIRFFFFTAGILSRLLINLIQSIYRPQVF